MAISHQMLEISIFDMSFRINDLWYQGTVSLSGVVTWPPGEVVAGPGEGLPPSVGSNLRALRPCLELLWTNMLSDTANKGPSTLIVVDIATWKTNKRSCPNLHIQCLRGRSQRRVAYFKTFSLCFDKDNVGYVDMLFIAACHSKPGLLWRMKISTNITARQAWCFLTFNNFDWLPLSNLGRQCDVNFCFHFITRHCSK